MRKKYFQRKYNKIIFVCTAYLCYNQFNEFPSEIKKRQEKV